MAVAWTTLLVIALLIPGVFVLVGASTFQRYSREIVKTTGMGEVALAFVVAILIHLIAWTILENCTSFNLKLFVWTVFFRNALSTRQFLAFTESAIWLLGWYIVITAILGFIIGVCLAKIPGLTTHRWLTRLGPRKTLGAVTAYIMTKTVENNRVLMYRGQLHEYYQYEDGRLSYVVLQNASRFFMLIEQKIPVTGSQKELFKTATTRGDKLWNYLMIHGENISNILVENVPQVKIDKQAEQTLDNVLAEEIERMLRVSEAQARR